MNQHEQDIAEARRRVAELTARFEGYDVGDRPMSPPVSLFRELRVAEDRLRELLLADRPLGRRVLAEVGSTIKVGGADGLTEGTYTVVRVGTAPGCSHIELRKVEP